MTLRVTDANGAEHEQEIEAGASSVLLPLGLTPTAVAVGERVTIRGNPSKRGAGTVLGRELVKADGSVLPLNIALGREPQGADGRRRHVDRGHVVSAAARLRRLRPGRGALVVDRARTRGARRRSTVGRRRTPTASP